MGPLPLSLWQITALLCQSVTHFPIWCLVTVSFIFIQLWITGRAYAASPVAIMWNTVREEELDAPQPRSDWQNKQAYWSNSRTCPASGSERTVRGAKRPNSLYYITSQKDTEVYGKCKARGGQTFWLLTHDRFENLTRGPNKSKSFVDPHHKRDKIMWYFENTCLMSIENEQKD